MIDWLTLAIRVDSPLNLGAIACISPNGEVEWTSPRRIAVERDSGDAKVQAWTKEGHLWISGNPAKWLYGHNWTGSNDVPAIASEFVASVLAHIEHDFYRVAEPSTWRLTRVDITRSFDFESNHAVNRMLQALEKAATLPYRGRGRFPTPEGRNTLYFGQSSRRWSLKLYNKWEEQKARGELLFTKLHGIAREGILRVELTLRGMELKERELETMAAWDGDTAMRLWNEYVSRLEISEQSLEMPEMKLPPRLYGIYEMWRRGVVLREAMSRASWYRARRELLEYGIDISGEPVVIPEAEVSTFTVPPLSQWRPVFEDCVTVPIARYIEA